jgi:GTP cyclohydrolase II
VSAVPEVPPLNRIHSECFTGDVLVSERCDCGPQLLEAVRRIAQVGSDRRRAGADRAAATKAGRGAHTLDLPYDDVLDAEA